MALAKWTACQGWRITGIRCQARRCGGLSAGKGFALLKVTPPTTAPPTSPMSS